MRPALLLGVTLLLAGCAGPTAVTRDTLEECVALPDASAQLACAEPLFAQASARGGVREALDALDGARRNGTLAHCHMLAHHLGHAAYETLANLSTALKLGDPRCVKGYYHGVLEAALGDRARRGESGVGDLCDPVRDQPEPWDGCVHGIGHGLMWRSGYDMPRSMRECDELPEGQARWQCKDGVVMEASLRHIAAPEDEYQRVAPLVCANVSIPPEWRLVCAAEVGAVAVLRYGLDLDRALPICARMTWSAEERERCESGARFEAEQQHA